jgi:class 3 adenylate cyclase
MSTSDYFVLSRRLIRAADQCVVDAGGLVGRHLGDGVTAFFLVEHLGSESAAARAAITAARELRVAATDIATQSGLEDGDVILRFGLHWGATLYVGLFKSVARSEVTAMGDEVNEAARIEACAVGGRALASKALIERLDHDDVRELDLEHVTYTLLGELDAATDKTRRDAASIAVCDV